MPLHRYPVYTDIRFYSSHFGQNTFQYHRVIISPTTRYSTVHRLMKLKWKTISPEMRQNPHQTNQTGQCSLLMHMHTCAHARTHAFKPTDRRINFYYLLLINNTIYCGKCKNLIYFKLIHAKIIHMKCQSR